MMPRLLGALLCAGLCCREAPETKHEAGHERPSAKNAAVVAPLTLEAQSARVVLQAVLDATDGKASLAACDALLGAPNLRIVTTEPKSFAVIMAMLATQLNATMTVDGAKWTAFCPTADGSGTLFRKGQTPTSVIVPKAPTDAGS